MKTSNKAGPTGLCDPTKLQNITGEQIKAARALLGWEQGDLARAAGISVPTINRMENLGPQRCMVRNLVRVLQAFAATGLEFIHKTLDGGVVIGVQRQSKE